MCNHRLSIVLSDSRPPFLLPLCPGENFESYQLKRFAGAIKQLTCALFPPESTDLRSIRLVNRDSLCVEKVQPNSKGTQRELKTNYIDGSERIRERGNKSKPKWKSGLRSQRRTKNIGTKFPTFAAIQHIDETFSASPGDLAQRQTDLIYWCEEYWTNTNTEPRHHMFLDLQTISSVYGSHDTDIYASSQFNIVTNLISRQSTAPPLDEAQDHPDTTIVAENQFANKETFTVPFNTPPIIPTNLDKQTFNPLVSLISSHSNQNPKATNPQASTQSVRQSKQSRPRASDFEYLQVHIRNLAICVKAANTESSSQTCKSLFERQRQSCQY
ncbi:hypothetical protein EAF00_003966 [Botryotinia globosa]|nr:hypothetical protein EAF00_003966 [Botryotinia globosa]